MRHIMSDGRTAYERIKGRRYTGLILEFGMSIFYLVSVEVQGEDMEPRWRRGIWLGKRFGTEDHAISTIEWHGPAQLCGEGQP